MASTYYYLSPDLAWFLNTPLTVLNLSEQPVFFCTLNCSSYPVKNETAGLKRDQYCTVVKK
jgi:hypothetical protein